MKRLPIHHFANLFLVGACAVVALLITGCGSTAMLDVSDVEQAENVAVPIIRVDPYIDLTDLQDGGSLATGDGAGTFAQRLLDDDSFDLAPMVALLREEVFDTYAQRLPVTVMPEQEVVEAERYQSFHHPEEDEVEMGRLLVPDGYKSYALPVSAIGSHEQQMFGAVPDAADALLFVSARYRMVEDNPFYYVFLPISPDKAFIEATVSMEMVDRDGNTIMKIRQTERSDSHVKTVGGISTQPDKIQPLCVEATESALATIDAVTQEELEGS